MVHFIKTLFISFEDATTSEHHLVILLLKITPVNKTSTSVKLGSQLACSCFYSHVRAPCVLSSHFTPFSASTFITRNTKDLLTACSTSGYVWKSCVLCHIGSNLNTNWSLHGELRHIIFPTRISNPGCVYKKEPVTQVTYRCVSSKHTASILHRKQFWQRISPITWFQKHCKISGKRKWKYMA